MRPGQPHAAHMSPSPGSQHASANAPGITEAVKILSSRRCASSEGLSRDAGLGAAWRQSTISTRLATLRPPQPPPASHSQHAGTRGAIAEAFPTLQPAGAEGGYRGEGWRRPAGAEAGAAGVPADTPQCPRTQVAAPTHLLGGCWGGFRRGRTLLARLQLLLHTSHGGDKGQRDGVPQRTQLPRKVTPTQHHVPQNHCKPCG